MARYRGPRLRITRRLGDLPGLSRKISTRPNPPGQHGDASKLQKLSQYVIRLREKQKLRFHYGVAESQLVRAVERARRMKGSTGQNLLVQLEMRLDNIIWRAGLTPTLRSARQLVSHRHICVNDLPVSIPSFQCQPGDKIRPSNRKSSQSFIQSILKSNGNSSATSYAPQAIPSHLQFTKSDQGTNWSGNVLGLVSRQDVGVEVNELLIIEYYSRII